MEQEVLKAKIALLTMLIERECSCDKTKCAEHFMYLESLRYEYQCMYEENRNNLSNQDAG